MLDQTKGRAIHMPANPDKFEFDTEVAEVFPDMAVRSIPNFLQAHKAHARIAEALMFSHGRLRVLDAGASRGHFIQAIRQTSHHRPSIVALDYSEAMVEHLKRDYRKGVEVRLCDMSSPEFLNSDETFDVINASYVLQFIPLNCQDAVLRKLCNMVRPGGLLFFGAKMAVHGELGALLQDEYIRWRMRQGYSREEIEAKTAALKNSMWLRSHAAIEYLLTSGGMVDITKSYVHTLFTNYVCIKAGIHYD